jgi:hypothetical protein
MPYFYIGLRYTEGLIASPPAKRSKHAALPAFGVLLRVLRKPKACVAKTKQGEQSKNASLRSAEGRQSCIFRRSLNKRSKQAFGVA